MGPPPRPGDRWRRLLEATAVPEAVVAEAPEPAVTLEPERFRWRPDEDARQPVRPSRRRALEALPQGGTVLDVGVGGGASSLGLVPRPGLIVGVDPLPDMLESFTASGRAAGVATRAVLGTWPGVAAEVEPADVAVCHHAIYRAEAIEDFLTALTHAARHRVVLELSAASPLSGLDDLWRTFHGIDRPAWDVADELQAVLAAMAEPAGSGGTVEPAGSGGRVEPAGSGGTVEPAGSGGMAEPAGSGGMAEPAGREDFVLAPRVQEVTPSLVAFARRRLYVGPERDAEIEEFLRSRQGQEHRVVALWWPGRAS